MKKSLCFAIAALLLCSLSAVGIGEESSATTIFWGHYPQQSDDPEPIEWLVLHEQDDQLLLLAKYCLASLPWHKAHIPITWDQSDIRAWLNDEFLQAAFTEEEQAAILLTDLGNGDDLGYGTPVGENTRDRVFLLSGGEVEQYLPTDDLHTVVPTR